MAFVFAINGIPEGFFRKLLGGHPFQQQALNLFLRPFESGGGGGLHGRDGGVESFSS